MALTSGTDMVTLKGRTDVGHIPAQPLWLFIVRCFQFLLALIILALSAWAGGTIGFFYAGFGVGIFAFVWTLLFLIYIEVSTFFAPVAYNKYIHLVLECLAVIFWLSAFASLATIATLSTLTSGLTTPGLTSPVCVGNYCVDKRDYTTDITNYVNATKAAAALGAIEWALFVGTLISFGIYLHRHRLAVRDAQLGAPPAAGGAAQQEIKMQPVVNQYPAEQQVPYQQQPYQQQPYQQQPYQQQPYQAQSMA